MSTRTLTLIFALPLLAACTEEPVAPNVEDAGLIQAAKGGKPGKPGGGGDPEVTITQTDLGTLEGSSSASANSVVSDPDGNSIRVVGASGGSPFFWTANGGMVKLTVPEDACPDEVGSAQEEVAVSCGVGSEGGSRSDDRSVEQGSAEIGVRRNLDMV